MLSYDTLLKRAVRQMTASVLRQSEAHDESLARTLVQMVQIRSGRDDDTVYREDISDVVREIVEATNAAMKSHLLKRLQRNLGADPAELEHALDAELAKVMPAEEIGRLLGSQRLN
jgi:hypothetical protein